MANIAISTDRNTLNGAILMTWASMGDSDTGAAFAVPFAAELTAQASGTFAGATVKLQGSNDGVNWFDLTKKGGTSTFSLAAAGGGAANEVPAYIRPFTTGGSGTAVTVVVCIKASYAKVAY